MTTNKLTIATALLLCMTSSLTQVEAVKRLAFMAEVGVHGHSYFPLKSKYNTLLQTNGEALEDYEAKNITALGIR